MVGSGEVCDACVVAALRGGTEEIAKYWYGKHETCPENVGMGIYLKQDQDVWSRFLLLRCRLLPENEVWGRTGQQAARPWCCVEGKESGRGIRLPKQSDDRVLQRPQMFLNQEAPLRLAKPLTDFGSVPCECVLAVRVCSVVCTRVCWCRRIFTYTHTHIPPADPPFVYTTYTIYYIHNQYHWSWQISCEGQGRCGPVCAGMRVCCGAAESLRTYTHAQTRRPKPSVITDGSYTKGTRVHTHRELIQVALGA